MSCGYCAIAVVMSSLKAATDGPASGDDYRHTGLSTADTVFGVFNSLGSVAFTFGGGQMGGGEGGRREGGPRCSEV